VEAYFFKSAKSIKNNFFQMLATNFVDKGHIKFDANAVIFNDINKLVANITKLTNKTTNCQQSLLII